MTTTLFATAAAEAFAQQSVDVEVFIDTNGNPVVDPDTVLSDWR